jgi:predicted nucleotidyltransferase component of viral defense system
MNQIYLDTAKLLTQVAPMVFADGVFALKGGTAINLFARDMPRLSVDLDLVFPDYIRKIDYSAPNEANESKAPKPAKKAK